MKTVKVHVAAGPEVEDARWTVEDVLELLNRHFRPRVEFVAAGQGEGDWTIALYWKDFGEMGRETFEEVYERFKKEKRPVIHVFFTEPDEGIGEALKAFKEAFAERYGHFYCHFETVDAVRFQLVAQSLSMLPGGSGNERTELAVEDGVVRLGNELVAKMANLSFGSMSCWDVYTMANNFLHGIGCPADPAEAERLFGIAYRKADQLDSKGYPGGTLVWARCEANGYGTPRDLHAALFDYQSYLHNVFNPDVKVEMERIKKMLDGETMQDCTL